MNTPKILWIGLFLFLCGCTSMFVVKSEPLQADVSFQDPKTGEKKPLGKTPLNMTTTEFNAATAGAATSGEFLTILVEKPGYLPQSFSLPATRFGTMVTDLDVKLKEGTQEKEARVAKDILDHLFLAQKFAISQQFERAQIEIDKILNDFPTFARALSMRASIYYAQKNYNESIRWFDEALKADPQMEDTIRIAAKVRALVSGTRIPAGTPGSPTNPTPLPGVTAPAAPPGAKGGNP